MIGPTPASGVDSAAWQLRMFELSLKKKQKLRLLLDMAGPLAGRRCLLLTCGDNNGALNHHFRAAGGEWIWADLEPEGIPEMEAFLGETVHAVRSDRLPFSDEAFDLVVVIDVHEHLERVDPINREIRRVLRRGGEAIVTTPSGDEELPVSRLKRWVGMDPEVYGHVVQGYRAEELERMLRRTGLEPRRRGAYSRFFTELIELAINFLYVRVLGGSGEGGAEIAPGSEESLRSVGRSFRLYSVAYPFLRAVSSLDDLLPGEGGYAVAVAARKPA